MRGASSPQMLDGCPLEIASDHGTHRQLEQKVVCHLNHAAQSHPPSC